MLTILGRSTSINVRKVLWCCDEIGLAYEQEAWGRGHRSPQEPEFLALNPNGLVPVLRDGPVVLWESNTIIRYLAASRGRDDLLPAQPAARAEVEQWMDWQGGDLNAAWRYAVYARVRKLPGYDDEDEIRASVKAWTRAMRVLEGQLAKAGDGFALGPDFTLADICLGLAVARWFEAPIDRPELPHAATYLQRLNRREAFRRHASDH